jgi:hypothetical protein
MNGQVFELKASGWLPIQHFNNNSKRSDQLNVPGMNAILFVASNNLLILLYQQRDFVS